MKYFLIVILIQISLTGCYKKCDTKDYYPIPERVKYNSMNLEVMERYVVKDASSYSYYQISNNSSINTLVKPFYESNFDKELIRSVDFKANSRVNVNIYSQGNLVSVIDTTYSQTRERLDMIGTLSYKYISMMLVPPSTITIPYVMSFYRKQGQSQIVNGLISDLGIRWQEKKYIIRDLIKSPGLQTNDTVFINKINLVYFAY